MKYPEILTLHVKQKIGELIPELYAINFDNLTLSSVKNVSVYAKFPAKWSVTL